MRAKTRWLQVVSFLLATITGQRLRLFGELSGVMDSKRACYFYGGVLLRGTFFCGAKGRVMHKGFVGGYRKLR